MRVQFAKNRIAGFFEILLFSIQNVFVIRPKTFIVVAHIGIADKDTIHFVFGAKFFACISQARPSLTFHVFLTCHEEASSCE